jgi:hypothetical protein
MRAGRNIDDSGIAMPRGPYALLSTFTLSFYTLGLLRAVPLALTCGPSGARP